MPGPKTLIPDESILAYWGSELRKHRLERHWSQEELGKQISYSTSLIGLIETARRAPSAAFAQKCDEVFVTNSFTRLHALIGKDSYPSWFRPFLELEREASTLRSFQPLVVPGLLQTREYAYALVRASSARWSEDQVNDVVDKRMSRQEILGRQDAPTFMALLDESVLDRPVGGAAVLKGQLERLIQVIERPHITVQVVPREVGAHAGLEGSMVVASFRGRSDIVYLESPGRGEIISEPEEVEALTWRMDAIRVLALPQSASVELIRRVM
ncbi:helix-turn-helix transcriptional regulator [Streptosporangium subroseum]|uniref:helix-turn-helix domain-containing protein n=1 Tax=Streptosporangium subroseum TaxID=106412 RepID=UPI003087083D|nr:helix-turn-helix transcriptional regulator [Streptosporangium subroseum]